MNMPGNKNPVGGLQIHVNGAEAIQTVPMLGRQNKFQYLSIIP